MARAYHAATRWAPPLAAWGHSAGGNLAAIAGTSGMISPSAWAARLPGSAGGERR